MQLSAWFAFLIASIRRAQILAKNKSYRARNLAIDASKIEL